MPRQRKVWFRKSTGCYYTQVHRKKVNLGRDYDRAEKEFHRLMLSVKASPGHVHSILDLAKAFLSWASTHIESCNWYRDFLEDFCEYHGDLPLSDITPLHVSEWYQDRPWNSTSQYHAAGALIRIMNWAVRHKILLDNPIAGMTRPEPQVRDRILTNDERKLILESLHTSRDSAFKLLLFALSQTGARPGEVRKVTAEHCRLDAGVWVFTKHKTKKRTKKNRLVYLTPAMVNLCRKLIIKHPTGPLFLNSRGKPWTRNAIRCRFRNLREKFPQLAGVVCYVWRHTYTTDALEKGQGQRTLNLI